MKYQILGRTGLRVSHIGLGGGGHSCLGRKRGKTEAQSVSVVQRALDLGINLIDTAGRNATENIIRRGIAGRERESLVLSTKRTVSDGGNLCSAADFARSVEDSLRELGTPYIDLMQFHGVLPQEYDYVVSELLPVMHRFRDAGKIRHIGITEIFDRDRQHIMLQRALEDDCWDVMMVGFNIVNQTARDAVLRPAAEKNIGILGMFAVRRALSSEEAFRAAVNELATQGKLSASVDIQAIIKALSAAGGHNASLASIAYRFCRDEPGVHSVLSGTGEVTHLEQNVASFQDPPLDKDTRRLIIDTFAGVADFSGN